MQNTNESNRQLTWADIPDQYYINRFSLEQGGRSYAVNYTVDPIVDVYRRIYLAYCKGHEHEFYYQPDGKEAVETGVFESDMKEAEEECEKRHKELEEEYKARQKKTVTTTTSAPFSFNFNFATVNPDRRSAPMALCPTGEASK